MIQTIVSRHTAPQQAAVVTVGSIHGGTRRNIIPDEVTMLLTIRSFSDQVQGNIVTDIRNAARGVSMAAGVPDSRSRATSYPRSSPAATSSGSRLTRPANAFGLTRDIRLTSICNSSRPSRRPSCITGPRPTPSP
jgi:hippurate hydrolase